MSPEEGPVLEYVVHLVLDLFDAASISSAAGAVSVAQVVHRHCEHGWRIGLITEWIRICPSSFRVRNFANFLELNSVPKN